MAETKQLLQARTESHSDVADTPAARALQTSLTEQKFGEALLRRIRELPNGAAVNNFQEEWVSTEDGLVFEIRVDVVPLEG